MKYKILSSLCFMLSLSITSLSEEQEIQDLLKLSFNDLMDIQVTSTTKQKTAASEASHAIYVITSEELRAFGARDLSDALKLVPGVQSMQINSSISAISIRGFANDFSDKLLVMIDGRSIYNSLFTGVFWGSTLALDIDEIERIEVVRGSGASVWGSNAVNGVINIITKHAGDLEGGKLSLGAGTNTLYKAHVRYGMYFDEDDIALRLSAKTEARDSFYHHTEKKDWEDDWSISSLTGKLDWNIDASSTLSVSSDFYRNRTHDMFTMRNPGFAPFITTVNEDIDEYKTTMGFNINAVLSRRIDHDTKWELQAYYDMFDRQTTLYEYLDNRIDINYTMTHEFKQHEFSWGLGYRVDLTDIDNTSYMHWDPADQSLETFTAFLQDKIQITDSLELILGNKFENNNYINFEFQPTARLAYTTKNEHTYWMAVSRAIQSPAQMNSDSSFYFSNPANFSLGFPVPPNTFPFVFAGDRDVKPERLISYEAGWRGKLGEKVYSDFTFFYNEYKDLKTLEHEVRPDNKYGINLLHVHFDNQAYGETYGTELLTHYDATQNLRLTLSYAFIKMALHTKPGGLKQNESHIYSENAYEGNTPQHTAGLRAQYTLANDVTVSAALSYTDNMAYFDISKYFNLDMTVNWQVSDTFHIRASGYNLLNHYTQQFDNGYIANSNTEVPRSFLVEASWSF